MTSWQQEANMVETVGPETLRGDAKDGLTAYNQEGCGCMHPFLLCGFNIGNPLFDAQRSSGHYSEPKTLLWVRGLVLFV